MKKIKEAIYSNLPGATTSFAFLFAILALLTPFNVFSASLSAVNIPDSVPVPQMPMLDLPELNATEPDSALINQAAFFADSLWQEAVPNSERTLILPDSVAANAESGEPVLDEYSKIDIRAKQIADSIAAAFDPDYVVRDFSPDPTRAVWLAALCPGLGQLYNRRYWKLPLVIGGFMGLAYGTSWNNQMLTDYTQGYRDLMDSDPNTKSYLDFYPPGTDESSLNTTWLQKTFKSRKDYFRRNRDLCIISMVGLYLVAIVDAYVDASLSHFDISPDLSVDFSPAIIQDARGTRPGIGLLWAVNF
jgi:hypothetical protein